MHPIEQQLQRCVIADALRELGGQHDHGRVDGRVNHSLRWRLGSLLLHERREQSFELRHFGEDRRFHRVRLRHVHRDAQLGVFQFISISTRCWSFRLSRSRTRAAFSQRLASLRIKLEQLAIVENVLEHVLDPLEGPVHRVELRRQLGLYVLALDDCLDEPRVVLALHQDETASFERVEQVD